jgi:SAM-dependent methyltransferase
MSRRLPVRSSPSSTSDPVNRCHICGSSNVDKLPQDGTPFRLVSSDVQPVDGAAEYLFCGNCSAVQKAVTPQWQAMANRIYANYDINHQSLGAEPMVFDTAKGSGPRSLILLRNFLDKVDLPETGRLLDFGCSNGNLLKSFHGLRPAWRLSGQELFDTWRDTVLALPGVEAFYSGAEPSYDGTFDVISLSHVLEHLQDPAAFLKRIACRLSDRGRILIASPNLRQNPIDLVNADHCTHFEEHSLSYVIDEAGLSTELLSSRLLPKELVAIVAPRRGQEGRSVQPTDSADAKERCLFYFRLLEEVRKAGRAAAAEKRPFGIMGSSIAACWMNLELAGAVDFFVDEDPDRVGHQLTGLPILPPAEVPPGSLVFIPMSVPVAEKIMGRWRELPIDFRFVASNRPV